jgi:hypothetical protein
MPRRWRRRSLQRFRAGLRPGLGFGRCRNEQIELRPGRRQLARPAPPQQEGSAGGERECRRNPRPERKTAEQSEWIAHRRCNLGGPHLGGRRRGLERHALNRRLRDRLGSRGWCGRRHLSSRARRSGRRRRRSSTLRTARRQRARRRSSLDRSPNRCGLRPCGSRRRRLVGGASDRALEAEILQPRRANGIGRGRVRGGLRRHSLGERDGGREPCSSRQQHRQHAQIRPHPLPLLNDSPHLSPAATSRQCPPRALTSSTWRMNGAETPIRRRPSVRRPAPARCRPRPRSRPVFRR